MALHLGCVASSLVLVTLPLTDTMTLLGAGGSLWGGAAWSAADYGLILQGCRWPSWHCHGGQGVPIRSGHRGFDFFSGFSTLQQPNGILHPVSWV